MNILFTTEHYLPTVNGVVTHVCLLKEELEKRGHTVYIVTQKTKAKKVQDKKVFYLPSLSIPIYIHAKDALVLPFNPVVKKKIENLPIDVVHNHLFITGLFGSVIAKEKQIPFVTTYHTFIRQYFDWVMPWAEKMTHPTAKWLDREYFKDNDAVIAPSRKAVLELTQANVVTPIYRIPNGIKLDIFKKSSPVLFQKKFGIDVQRPLIVIVGALEVGKNVAIAIESIALLKQVIPDIQLGIVGDGKERKNLEKLIHKFKLTNNVFITGFLDSELVASANKAADVVLFTSDTDNFPTVLIEALAAGKPIVAVKDKAIEDLVKDHQNGFVVKKDAHEIAKALESLITNSSVRTTYGKKSFLMSKQFSIERYVDRLEALYTSLIQNSH